MILEIEVGNCIALEVSRQPCRKLLKQCPNRERGIFAPVSPLSGRVCIAYQKPLKDNRPQPAEFYSTVVVPHPHVTIAHHPCEDDPSVSVRYGIR